MSDRRLMFPHDLLPPVEGYDLPPGDGKLYMGPFPKGTPPLVRSGAGTLVPAQNPSVLCDGNGFVVFVTPDTYEFKLSEHADGRINYSLSYIGEGECPYRGVKKGWPGGLLSQYYASPADFELHRAYEELREAEEKIARAKAALIRSARLSWQEKFEPEESWHRSIIRKGMKP